MRVIKCGKSKTHNCCHCKNYTHAGSGGIVCTLYYHCRYWMIPKHTEPGRFDIKFYKPVTWFQRHIPFWLYTKLYKSTSVFTKCYPISMGEINFNNDIASIDVNFNYDSYRNPLSEQAVDAFNKAKSLTESNIKLDGSNPLPKSKKPSIHPKPQGK